MSTLSVYGVIHHGHIDATTAINKKAGFIRTSKPQVKPIKKPKEAPKPTPEPILKHPEAAPIDLASFAPAIPVPAAKISAVQAAVVPDEIRRLKWNWGAFLLSSIWLVGHKLYGAAVVYLLSVYCLVFLTSHLPSLHLAGIASGVSITWLVYILPSIFAGLVGYKVAWRKVKTDNVQQFLAVESRWTIAGLTVTLLEIAARVGIGFVHH